MSKRTPKLLLEDILESAIKIQNYTKGYSYESFIADTKTVDAVVRNFEIIGEAANKLPEDFRAEKTEIDWHKIRGFRNRLVHNYFGIDLSIIWTIKETMLDKLIEDMKELIESNNVI